MFSSQLNGAVQRAGLIPQTCLGMKTCLEALERGGMRWVIIDLELPGVDVNAIHNARHDGCRLLSFGPHVHEELLQNAKAAGCDFVITRGQAASGLDKYLQVE